MECLKCEQEEFVLDSVGYGEPVELDEDRCDVLYGFGSSDYSCCSVMDILESLDEFLGEASEESITVIQA